MKKVAVTAFLFFLAGAYPAASGSLIPVIEHEEPGAAVQAIVSKASQAHLKGEATIPAAVLAEDQASGGIVTSIVQGLSESGRFIVVDRTQVEAAVVKSSRRGADLAQDVMNGLKLQALIIVRSWPMDGQDLLAVRIFYRKAVGEPETLLFSIRQENGRADRKQSQPSITPASIRLDPADSYDIPVTMRYMAILDLDRDGTVEYVFSDGKKLYLFRRDNSTWKSIWTGGAQDERHYYLDAADVNGNGKPEIVVAGMRSGKVVTTVYEASGGVVEAIAEISGFARILARPGSGPVLLRQDHDRNGYFTGTPRLVPWSAAGGFTDDEEFPLPRGVGLFDFVPARFGEQVPLLVATSSDDRATVYSRGALVWKSEELYWGAETVLVEESQDAYSVQRKKTIKSRLIALDLTGTGREYVIFPKNKKVLFGANEGAFHVLAWTGARLERMTSVQDLPGPVLDMQATGGVNKESFIYVLVQVEGGIFSGPSSRLLVYRVLVK